MAIALYPHNESAYLAVLDMLQETGKAAVIHPAGTGKSFIGFKLCEDFPEKKICWLSPSKYIFQTQLKNLAAESGVTPENITFLTYARLMTMDADEIAAIQPDFIILDEFHRCGAEQWGHGVQALLNAYITQDGICLETWIQRTRKWYKQNKLTSRQIKRLEAIGMVWDGISDRWERNYQAATEYYQEHGDLRVPTKYVSADGLNLGMWIQSTRKSYRKGMLDRE